ncbi:MAG TPA: PDZ domain-containing protein, partial [Nocardioidaceae bacterium]
VSSTTKVDKRPDDQAAAQDENKVDLNRVRIEIEPQAEWRQMYDEAWRLMRDHYWRPDMGGTDWGAARERYAPLLSRLGSHDDLVDLIWELQGELGTSHAYVLPDPDDVEPTRRQGLLGADLEYADDAWRIARVIPGEPSDRNARSPLTAPGVGARVGDAIVAVDGRRPSRTRSPYALMLGTADKPVELTIAPADGGAARRAVVVPLADEMPLRYQDWVNDRRRYVHEQTAGRVGYLHVPDMVSGGWAQLHRDLRTEMRRDALIVDVRANRGGHTSQLVVEKLARRVIGWDLTRGYEPESYPLDARRGPLVAVTDMYAGSDGDIVTAAIQSLGLGQVVGTRTWGGVVGIDGRYRLIDGTLVTQPRYAFWFEDFGWGVENYGVDPDVEVEVAPQDRVAGNDVQLDRALALVEQQLRRTPPKVAPALPDL